MDIFIFWKILWSKYYLHPHFSSEETETQQGEAAVQGDGDVSSLSATNHYIPQPPVKGQKDWSETRVELALPLLIFRVLNLIGLKFNRSKNTL